MLCNQCQETVKSTGCITKGVCGKTAETSDLQDVLIYACQGLSYLTIEARKKGIDTTEESRLITKSLFTTITNANFDDDSIKQLIKECLEFRYKLLKQVEVSENHCCIHWSPKNDEEILAKAKKENQRLTKQINTKLDRYTPDTTLCDSIVADYQQLTDTLQHEITALEKRDSVQDSIIMLERFLFNEANTKLMETSDLLMETSESFELYKKKQDTWWNRNQKYIYFGLGVATTYILTK